VQSDGKAGVGSTAGEAKEAMTRLDRIIVALCAIGFLLCCTGIARGQDRPLYWASVAVLTAANVADVHSSWGKFEVNPLLRSADGRFGVRGAVVKSGISAGTLTVQALVLRRWPHARKAASIANFVAAGVVCWVAVRNYQLQLLGGNK